MTTCDEFQIALEMDARGQLDPAAREALARHVEGCEACLRMRALIGALPVSPPPPPPLPVDRLLGRARRRTAWLVARVALVGLALAGASFAVLPFGQALGAVLLGAGLVGWIAWQARARDAALRALGARPGELFGALRA